MKSPMEHSFRSLGVHDEPKMLVRVLIFSCEDGLRCDSIQYHNFP
jgi:hypothetical protein